jgi:hypothetical protein
LVVGVAVTELAARSRHHLEAADDQAEYIAMIHYLAELASGSAPASLVVQDTENLLTQLLALRACHFEVDPAERPVARIEADGRIVHAGIRWPTHEIGIPGPEAEIPVRWRSHLRGRFVLTPTPGHAVSVERRVVAVALADFVGAALSEQSSAA